MSRGGESTPSALRVEHTENPLGIQRKHPRFGWQFEGRLRTQTAYEIRVGSTLGENGLPEPDVWESGWVESGASTNVRYDGSDLQSGTRYHWVVRVRDEDDVVGPWSQPAWFETGLFDASDWHGEWIGLDPSDSPGTEAPYLRAEFDLGAVVERARVYVTGLGYYELSCNGERVGDRVLDPGQTNYDERVLYATYDVTDCLTEGANAVGVALGRGRYGELVDSSWSWNEAPWHNDESHLRFQLEAELADGTTRRVTSDGTWRGTAGATKYDSLFEGEVYDARDEPDGWTEPEFDDGEWDDVVVVDGPDGDLVAQQCPPIEVVETRDPEWISEARPGVYVVDTGQMVAGWIELSVDGRAGDEVTVQYGERRDDDGTVNVDDLYRGTLVRDFVDGTLQTDTYVCVGEGRETWEPRFSYKGFRYVEIRGYPGEPTVEDVTVKVVHSAVDRGWDSRFESSNELLDRIHENTRWALLNNHHSIPTDTPVYEKNGWTGDAQITAEAAIYNFDMVQFYWKWMADVADAQLESGEIPNIVPSPGWGYRDSPLGTVATPSPAWDAAYPLICWWVYRYYGDRAILEEHVEGMQRLVSYLGEYVESDGTIRVGHPDHRPPLLGSNRGDHPEGPAIVVTAYYYRLLEVVAEVSDVLGRDDDRERFRSLAAEVRQSFNDAFFDAERGIFVTEEYDGYRQTSNLLPLAFDIVPDDHRDRVIENLVRDVMDTHDGHLNTGCVGAKHLLPVLTEAGHLEAAYTVATQTTYPSWGYWITQNDATALYEAWELPGRSRDHHFQGAIDDWFYRYLAGIRPAETGFETVQVRPHFPADLEEVDAAVETLRGTVSIHWVQRDDGIRLSVTVPSNTDAVVHVPADDRDDITIEHISSEDDTSREAALDAVPLSAVAAVDSRVEAERVVCTVPAGDWTFHVTQ